MGCVETIAYDKFPKQRDKNYKYPYMAVGARVKVCFNYDTSKYCMGTIVRSDTEEPFEEIIRLDDGRFIRAVECQYQYVNDEESEEKSMLHNVTVKHEENKVLEEVWVMRAIKEGKLPFDFKKTVIDERKLDHEPSKNEIAQFLSDSKADFASVVQNYRFENELPF